VNPERITHSNLTLCLRDAQSELSASEAHGIAAGLVAAGIRTADHLLKEGLSANAAADDPATRECRDALHTLFAVAIDDFADTSFVFTPLLPDEPMPLPERSAALRDWCEGFLFGFGIADTTPGQLPEKVSEALQDMGEIARLDPSTIAGREEEEEAYAELVEFLRMAVLLIHEEILENRGAAS